MFKKALIAVAVVSTLAPSLSGAAGYVWSSNITFDGGANEEESFKQWMVEKGLAADLSAASYMGVMWSNLTAWNDALAAHNNDLALTVATANKTPEQIASEQLATQWEADKVRDKAQDQRLQDLNAKIEADHADAQAQAVAASMAAQKQYYADEAKREGDALTQANIARTSSQGVDKTHRDYWLYSAQPDAVQWRKAEIVSHTGSPADLGGMKPSARLDWPQVVNGVVISDGSHPAFNLANAVDAGSVLTPADVNISHVALVQANPLTKGTQPAEPATSSEGLTPDTPQPTAQKKVNKPLIVRPAAPLAQPYNVPAQPVVTVNTPQIQTQVTPVALSAPAPVVALPGGKLKEPRQSAMIAPGQAPTANPAPDFKKRQQVSTKPPVSIIQAIPQQQTYVNPALIKGSQHVTAIIKSAAPATPATDSDSVPGVVTPTFQKNTVQSLSPVAPLSPQPTVQPTLTPVLLSSVNPPAQKLNVKSAAPSGTVQITSGDPGNPQKQPVFKVHQNITLTPVASVQPRPLPAVQGAPVLVADTHQPVTQLTKVAAAPADVQTLAEPAPGGNLSPTFKKQPVQSVAPVMTPAPRPTVQATLTPHLITSTVTPVAEAGSAAPADVQTFSEPAPGNPQPTFKRQPVQSLTPAAPLQPRPVTQTQIQPVLLTASAPLVAVQKVAAPAANNTDSDSVPGVVAPTFKKQTVQNVAPVMTVNPQPTVQTQVQPVVLANTHQPVTSAKSAAPATSVTDSDSVPGSVEPDFKKQTVQTLTPVESVQPVPTQKPQNAPQATQSVSNTLTPVRTSYNVPALPVAPVSVPVKQSYNVPATPQPAVNQKPQKQIYNVPATPQPQVTVPAATIQATPKPKTTAQPVPVPVQQHQPSQVVKKRPVKPQVQTFPMTDLTPSNQPQQQSVMFIDTDAIGNLQMQISDNYQYATSTALQVWQANHDYTNQKFNQLKKEVDSNRKESQAGIASVAAMANIPEVQAGQTFMMGVGIGSRGSESAVSVGASYHLGESVTVKTSVAADTSSGVTLGAGFGVGY